jgi:hypothetical protein
VGLKAGALLVREWKGQLEPVMVLEKGFAWNGQTFGSLSQIAKAMTLCCCDGHKNRRDRMKLSARSRDCLIASPPTCGGTEGDSN